MNGIYEVGCGLWARICTYIKVKERQGGRPRIYPHSIGQEEKNKESNAIWSAAVVVVAVVFARR